jgi:hypothetical protein
MLITARRTRSGPADVVSVSRNFSSGGEFMEHQRSERRENDFLIAEAIMKNQQLV